jgi:hypothetical protein
VCGYCKVFERAHATRARHTRTPHARYSNTPYSLSATPSGQPEAASLYVSAQCSPARPRAARSLALCRTHAQSRTHASHTHASHTHTHTRCTHAHILPHAMQTRHSPLLTRRPPPDGPRLDRQRVRWCRTEARATQANARSCDTISRCSSCYSLKQLARTSRVRFPIGSSAGPGAGGGAGGAASRDGQSEIRGFKSENEDTTLWDHRTRAVRQGHVRLI